ncbi:hypothetical protein HZS_6426, partial [Henneguya salminicola]
CTPSALSATFSLSIRQKADSKFSENWDARYLLGARYLLENTQILIQLPLLKPHQNINAVSLNIHDNRV